MLNNLYTSTNMIKQAMPFVPLADKTGLHAQHHARQAPIIAQRKFESEYVHPILGKLEPYTNHPFNIGNNTLQREIPMSEAYDKIIQAQGFTHNNITRDPNYINRLNSYRSSPNSQLRPIPESLKFFYMHDLDPEISELLPALKVPYYSPDVNSVNSTPMSQDTIRRLHHPYTGGINGLYDYFNNRYNYLSRNDYNNTQTSVVAHEALGHAGNFPVDFTSFYRPIAEREGKSFNEIVPIREKFLPTYWGQGSNGEAEFTQSLHAAKRQGREWGYPVDSDNDEEVTQAFRDTLNRIQRIPIEQARQLPVESQRLRAYLNNARQYNSYREDPDSNQLMNKIRKLYNEFESYGAEDQNNPQLMDQTTEDVLYYTTPETLKGLLARNNN